MLTSIDSWLPIDGGWRNREGQKCKGEKTGRDWQEKNSEGTDKLERGGSVT